MSRSPKYSRVQARAEARRRREERRQERERRRAERIAQQQRAALERAREQARSRLDELRGEVDAAEARAAGAPVATEPGDLRRVLDRAGRGIDESADAEAVAGHVTALAEVEAGLASLASEVAIHRGRQERAPQLEALVALCGEVDAGDRRRFDDRGQAEVDTALRALGDALGRGDLDAFDGAVVAAADRARRHMRKVAAARAEEDRRRAELEVAVEELRATWEMLAGDARATGVTLSEAEIVPDAIDLVYGKLMSGNFKSGLEIAAKLRRRLGHTERALDDAIDRLVEGHQVMQAVIESLPNLGFAVEPESLVEQPDGTMGVRADKATGETLHIVVQDDPAGDQRIFYTTPEMAAAQEHGGVRGDEACANLETLLGRLNELVSQRGDFEVGAVDWDGRNGDELPPAQQMRLVPAAPDEKERWVVVA